MVACTHTHTGPQLSAEPEYTEQLKERIADSIAAAVDDLKPRELRCGRAQLRGVSFVRRYRMKDGSVVTNPGLLNPDVDHPLGDIDPELQTLRVVENGVTRAALVNFALHCDTVGGNLISAGWPCFMGEKLKDELGPAACVFMLQGACGDINHWDVFKGGHLKGFEEAERIGGIVAEAASQAMRGDTELTEGPAQGILGQVELPIPEVSDEAYAEAQDVMSRPYDSDADFTMDRVVARKRVRVREWPGESVSAEAQALRLGPMAFVGVPCELFNALGRQIKERSPFSPTWVCELANGSIGYVAERQDYEEGGYETASSMVAPGGGEMLRDKALDLLGQLRTSL
jgi:hypothetical protein